MYTGLGACNGVRERGGEEGVCYAVCIVWQYALGVLVWTVACSFTLIVTCVMYGSVFRCVVNSLNSKLVFLFAFCFLLLLFAWEIRIEQWEIVARMLVITLMHRYIYKFIIYRSSLMLPVTTRLELWVDVGRRSLASPIRGWSQSAVGEDIRGSDRRRRGWLGHEQT